MPYELYLKHFDRSGSPKNSVIEPVWARFTESVSGQEPLVFALDVDHKNAGDFEELDILQVMLRNTELGIADFTSAFVGILRDQDIAIDDDGVEYLTFTCPNEKHILSWRHILWYSGVANRSEFSAVPAETILKTIVKYNLTSFATVVNGRQRAGDLAPGMGIDITIEADAGGGTSRSIAVMGDNVLNALQKITEGGSANGDFSLRWQGLNDWLFSWHAGQLGVDKSTGADRVLFSTEPGNNTMLRPRYTRRGARATTAIAAGKGEKLARAIDPVNGPDYAADYDLETFVDARNEDTAGGRQMRGVIQLNKDRILETLTFDVQQTANQFYSPIAVAGRKTYRAGDLVLATYGIEATRKVESVAVTWEAPDRGDAFKVSMTVREV